MSRFEINDDDGTLAIEAGRFRLSFVNDGRRWSHSIAIDDRVVVVSQEADPDRDDPLRIVTPTFQQCHLQQVPQGRQALLVGLWGAHHCSAVFHVEEPEEWGEGGSEVTIKVDVASRSRSTLLGFASTYRVLLTSQDLLHADESVIDWRLPVSDIAGLRLVAEGNSRLVAAEAGRRETVAQVDVPIEPSSATQRLIYQWQGRYH